MTSSITDKLKEKLAFDLPVTDVPPRLQPILARLIEIVEVLHGCSDGNCRILGPRGGQHTNGGCRCRDNIKYALMDLAKELLKND